MKCRHWVECGVPGGGCCTERHFGGQPSLGVCRACPHYDGPPRGAGDVVAAITVATGIAAVVKAVAGNDCGCAQRQQMLNDKIPFM